MKLHYKQQGSGQPILLLHGVLGSLDNLNVLARDLVNHYQTIQVDMRNHGLSPWSDVMDYTAMAEDIIELCHALQLTDVIVIGHSMGGKVAMKLTEMAPDIIKQIIVLDIAPVAYLDEVNKPDPNKKVFTALSHCMDLTDRQQIIATLQHFELTEPTIQFLLKSFKQGRWLFNFAVIQQHYDQIRSWQTITPWLTPTLFIRGGNSHYVDDDDYAEIVQQFPYAQITTIEGAGHNVHAEKPQDVLQVLHDWLIEI